MIVRNFLYRLASLLGDINAVRRGTVAQRVVRKTMWKLFSRVMK